MKPNRPKRGAFNTRIDASLKQRLEEDAAEAGRSLSEEIERRLDQSYGIEERYGGRAASRLFQLMGQIVKVVEENGDGEWHISPVGYHAVRKAWDVMLDHCEPEGTKSTPLDHLDFASSFGKELGGLRIAALAKDMPKTEPEPKPKTKARKRQRKT